MTMNHDTHHWNGADQPIEGLRLGDLSARAAKLWPAREALIHEDRRLTYAQLEAGVDQVARALLAQGIGRGDHLAVWITNRPEFLFSLLGAARIGAVAIPLNTRWRSRDLEVALRNSEAKLLISDARSGPVDFEAMLHEILGADAGASLPHLRHVVLLEPPVQLAQAQPWADFIANGNGIAADRLAQVAAQVRCEDPALILYTSGSTGLPKGAILAHRSVTMSAALCDCIDLRAEDAQINYMPLFHIYAIIFAALPCILRGARHVLINKFDPAHVLQAITYERGTVLHGYDTHFNDIIDRLEAAPEQYDVTSLRWGTFAAGLATAVTTARRVQERLCRTVSVYGLSETGGSVLSGDTASTLEQSCETSGKPLSGVEVRVIDPETGRDMPPGEMGEIIIRAPTNMLGYWKNPEATAATLDAEGFVHTGDSGILRPDGYLRFNGRYKDMIKVGGENVDPAEIETLLLETGCVEQVAVVSCPDARLSEVTAAWIVLCEGRCRDDLLEAAERMFKGRVASFKIPRRYEVIERLPTSFAGKVDKKALREMLLARIAQEANRHEH